MKCQEIINELKILSSEKYKANVVRMGIPEDTSLGVSIANLRKLAKEVKNGQISKAEIESNKFIIIVPGASLTIALDKTDDDYENIIQGMKQKLREKKEQK